MARTLLCVLTRLDEALLHQAPSTFAAATTSDHRFYDRCWVAAYDPSGGSALNLGLGVYKNMNVADGFCCFVRGDRQHNVRVSRALRPHVEDTSVGPLRYEVVEPYRHVRVALAPGSHGLSCSLDWRATLPPFVERPTITEIDGRLATQVQRYDQTGTVDGWIDLDDHRVLVDGWFGARDHSWGVRGGVGGYEPVTGSPRLAGGFLLTWLLFRVDDFGGYLQLSRDGLGNETFLDGRIRHGDADTNRSVRAVDAKLEFEADSRWYRRAALHVVDDDDNTYDFECERLSPPIVMHGAGYDGGFRDRGGLGVHRDTVVEADAYDLSIDGDPRLVSDGTPVRGTQTEQPVAVVVNGRRGVGDLTVIAVGDLARYGVPAGKGAHP